MKQLFSILIITGIATSGFCQTKLISHKSHSGCMDTFGMAVENNLFDIGESNFGDPPTSMVMKFTIDSVIHLGDDKALIISSEKEVEEYLSYSGKPLASSCSQDFKGRDTVANHPLFSKKHSLDSIKAEMMYGQNRKAVFIGYDNDKQAQQKENRKKKKKSVIPIITEDTGFPPKGLLVMILAILSGVVALTCYLYNKRAALSNA